MMKRILLVALCVLAHSTLLPAASIVILGKDVKVAGKHWRPYSMHDCPTAYGGLSRNRNATKRERLRMENCILGLPVGVRWSS